jgi:hypothetical protein
VTFYPSEYSVSEISNRVDEIASSLGISSEVTAALGPLFYSIPVLLKSRISLGFLGPGVFQSGDLKEVREVVRVAGVDSPFVREPVPLREFGDAGLEGAFDGIARQIVSPVVHPEVGEGLRLAQPDSGQGL